MSSTDHELLTEIDGVGETRARALLRHFGEGSEVAKSACRYWHEITKVEGFTEASAKTMFDRMQEAGVFYDLRGY